MKISFIKNESKIITTEVKSRVFTSCRQLVIKQICEDREFWLASIDGDEFHDIPPGKFELTAQVSASCSECWACIEAIETPCVIETSCPTSSMPSCSISSAFYDCNQCDDSAPCDGVWSPSLGQFHVFTITKEACCELTVSTSVGEFTLHKKQMTFSSSEFGCLVTLNSISGDCLCGTHIITQKLK